MAVAATVVEADTSRAMLHVLPQSLAVSDHRSSRQGKILKRQEKTLQTRMLAVVIKKLLRRLRRSMKKRSRKLMIRGRGRLDLEDNWFSHL